MPLLEPTKELLRFLQRNPGVRARIRAAPNSTLLYAGDFIRPIWQELLDSKRLDPQFAGKQILPEVLARIALPGMAFPDLLAWVKDIDTLPPPLWRENGFVAWRALSGIFASNAVGAVSFQVGSGISKEGKVFAATEISVLSRNPNVDSTTRDILAYYLRCLQTRQVDMNFGFVSR